MNNTICLVSLPQASEPSVNFDRSKMVYYVTVSKHQSSSKQCKPCLKHQCFIMQFPYTTAINHYSFSLH